MEIQQLQESICYFSLDAGPRGNQGYSRVLLQLFGYTGHGKSSFINSCKYVLNDGEEFIAHAEAAGNNEPLTMERKSYELTKNIIIVDNRGCSTMNSFQRAEIYSQLGNFIPIGQKVEWMKDYKDMMSRLEDAELNPNYSDFIVPILIYRVTTKVNSDDKKALKEFVKNCVEMTGVIPIIVITHKTSGDFMETEKMFRLMGAENIISIENYTTENHIKTQGRTKDILTILHSALKNVIYRLGEKERDPQGDWRQRKKFMLEYIHKAEMEKKENDRRKEEEWKSEEERRSEEDRNPLRDLLLLEYRHMVEVKNKVDELRKDEERRRAEEDRESGCLTQ